MDQISRTLKPERIVVVCNSAPGNKPEIVCQRGLPEKSKLGSAEISLSTIKSVLRDGRSTSLVDANSLNSQEITESVFVCGLNSIVCAPISGKSGLSLGVLYADDRREAGRFLQEHADWLAKLGSALGSKALVPEPDASFKDESISSLEKEDIWREIYIQGIQARQKRCYKEAHKILTKALTYCRYRKIGGVSLASNLNAIAEVQRLQGDLDKAESTIRECLEVVKVENIRDLKFVVKFHNNLAGIKYAQNDKTAASAIYQQVLLNLDAEGLANSHLAVPILSNLGTLKSTEGEKSLAASFFKKAHDLASTHWGVDDPRTKICLEKLQALEK